MPSYGSLLDPALLSRVADLELVARIVVEGLVSGLHRSPFHGYSAEFSQSRHYQPGDDLKYVDWKLLARTDRLFTKQFRETTNTSAQIVLDCSGSMAFPPERAVSKFWYARVVAATLGYLIAMQGDAVGLVADRHGDSLYIGAKAGRAHLRRMLAALSRAEAGGPSSLNRTIARSADLLPRRGLMLVISDFYDAEDETFTELKRATKRGHEVAAFHVVSRAELELPYPDVAEFEDLETSERAIVHPPAARSGYRDRIAEFIERWRTRTQAEGIEYTLLVTDVPIDEALRKYLLRRS
jgi:uncharacterized protein (DUF58 family)